MQDMLGYLGAAAVPAAGFALFAAKLLWAVAKRDGTIDALSKAVQALETRVAEHDDLRERMARMEQSMEEVRRVLDRIEKYLQVRPA